MNVEFWEVKTEVVDVEKKNEEAPFLRTVCHFVLAQRRVETKIYDDSINFLGFVRIPSPNHSRIIS